MILHKKKIEYFKLNCKSVVMVAQKCKRKFVGGNFGIFEC